MSIEKLIDDYKLLCEEIKGLRKKEEVLRAEILSIIDFNPEGQKTIKYAPGKSAVVKAGIGYRVHSDRASQVINDIPDDFNPFTKQVSYKFDKKKYDMLKLYPEYLALVEPCIETYSKSVSLEVK